jgi:hypothetical protein
MRLCRSICAGLAVFACAVGAVANNDVWQFAVSGNWGDGFRWVDGSTPGPADTATFDKPGTYIVTFNANPLAIQALSVTDGSVTFTGGGVARQLNVNASGSNTVTIAGGSTLALSTSGSSVHLNGISSLNVGSGLNTSQFLVNFGSHVSTPGTNLGLTGNGTMIVDGANSDLISGSAMRIGRNGFAGQLSFRNAATGRLGAIELAESTTPGTTGMLRVESDADVVAVDDLTLAASAGSVGAATLNIHGTGSTLTQNLIGFLDQDNSVVVGNSSTGSAALNIGVAASGGTLTTGIGGMRVENTGTVTIGSGPNTGTLVSNGLLQLYGGQMTVGPGSTLNLIGVNPSVGIFGGHLDVDAAASVNYNGNLFIGNGGTANFGGFVPANFLTIDTGASLTASGIVNNGTMVVDGSTSSVVANGIGLAANSNTSFQNGAIATIASSLSMIADNFYDSSLVFESGAQLTTGSFDLVSFRNFVSPSVHTATATVTGTGTNVSIVPGGSLTLGGPAELYQDGPAILNVLDEANFIVGAGGTTVLKPGAEINIDDATVDLATLDNQGGHVNLVSGRLSFIGDLSVGTDGVLGKNVTLEGGQHVTLSGTTTVDFGRTLTLDGGTLETGDLDIEGTFNFIAGNLAINEEGASVDHPIVTNPTTTITVNANNVSLGDATSVGFQHQGVLLVGSTTLTLNSGGYARLGVGTLLLGSTVVAPNGVYLSGGSNLVGFGAVNARVTGDGGSVIEALGPLALGDAASVAGFNYEGELRTKQYAVTLNSSATVGLGNLTTLGNGATPGTLNATNGFFIDVDEAMTGYGTINSTNTLAKRSIINGTVQGASPTHRITLTGYIKGIGTFTDVIFVGTFSPGLSPVHLTAGNLAFGATNSLVMEIGGVAPGSGYDQIQATGSLDLGGTLVVTLIDGFAPQLGNQFNLFDWNSVLGIFASLQLPALVGNLSWNTSQLYTAGILSVVAGVPGDYNQDGKVSAADYTVWRNNLGSVASLPNDDTNGVGADDYLRWKTHFGEMVGGAGGGSAGSPYSTVAVPEPATVLLFLLSVAPLLGEAIKRIHRNESVSRLFR